MENVQIVYGGEVTSSRLRLAQLLSGATSGSPLIDIGTTSLTGIRSGAVRGQYAEWGTSHPIHATLALEAADCLRLGSDFVRTGLLFKEPETENGHWVDQFGVDWLRDQGSLAPFRHPLEAADHMELARHPRPQWMQPVQNIEDEIANRSLVIADAPCPGLLDLCFMLRNGWQFMEDCAANRRMASALLDWSLETIVESYVYMLGTLTREPDVLVYCDDLGFGENMFFSPSDFRAYIRPRLRALVTRLRSLTSAAICFHSCGAISAILSDIADLGFEILNLDTRAVGMGVRHVRQTLPASMVLHGTNDLRALGAAIENQDKAKIASLITELAHNAPVIVAPLDSLSSTREMREVARGAAFIRNLSDEDFDCLRQVGPVRSIIQDALRRTLSAPSPEFCPQHRHADESSHIQDSQFALIGKEVRPKGANSLNESAEGAPSTLQTTTTHQRSEAK